MTDSCKLKNEGILFSGCFVITGGQLYGNLGATAMSIIVIKYLVRKYPKSKIVFLSKYPIGDTDNLEKFKIEKQNVKIQACSQIQATCIEVPLLVLQFFFPKKNKIFQTKVQKILLDADIFIDIGGITFSEDRGIIGLAINATWVLLGSLSKKPIIKLSQAFGPFNAYWFRKISQILLNRVSLIVSRGKFSTRELNKLNLKTQIKESSDLTFLLTDMTRLKRLNSKYIVFGIAPSSVLYKKMGKDQYVKLMVDCINLIVKDYNSKIFLIAHSFRTENTLSNNDAPICELIYNKLSNVIKENCFLITDIFDPLEMRNIIGRIDIFLSCRFHAMVNALSLGVPTGVIGWSHKYREVQHQFGIDLCIDYKEVTVDEISNLIMYLVENRFKLQKQITNHLPTIVESANINFDMLSKVIDKQISGN